MCLCSLFRNFNPNIKMTTVINFPDLHPMLIGVLALLGVYLVHRFILSDPKRKHLPPLVPGPPIINHTFIHLEPEFPWRLTKWAEEYGEIFRTKSAATDFIWLNSPRAIKDIIDRRSAIYSSRQPQPMALGAASGGKRMTFMPKSKRWRTLRAIIHRVLKLKNHLLIVVADTTNGFEVRANSDFRGQAVECQSVG
jgi:hypothetical protein